MRICNYVGSHSKMARWTPSPEPIIRVGNLALRPNFIVVNLFGNRQVQRPLATPTSADHTYASPTTFSSSSRGESCHRGAHAHCGAHRAGRTPSGTLGLAPTLVAHQTAWECLGPRTCTNKVNGFDHRMGQTLDTYRRTMALARARAFPRFRGTGS